MVSDFCTEIRAIGVALYKGGKLPGAIQTFVEHYFIQKPRTPEQLAEAECLRYVSRAELMKAELRMAESIKLDGEQLRTVHRFINGEGYIPG
jgi:hypothetical protein